MKKLLLLLPFVFVSCTSTFKTEGGRGSLASYKAAQVVVSSDDSGDKKCKATTIKQLQSRGLADAGGGLTVRMSDTWKYDWQWFGMSMYIDSLSLTFTDQKSGELKASAHYKNSPAHSFPSGEKLVEKLFSELDDKGVFKR